MHVIEPLREGIEYFSRTFPVARLLQWVLNLSLIGFALTLSVSLIKSLAVIFTIIMDEHTDYQHFLGKILIFFLYFEFISMTVKYFRDQYHFPLRYFIYIGITAMIRLIIVEHHNPTHTLLYAIVILTLIIGYFIINKTPRERPEP
ncbi:phosphate-starvation-inducible protein PsiE [Ammoniphilus sp. 3BR4]|uniref:phosphate-starvation-inducible protein PsiE n=1 Tax=Ammoniphilus sp. 3BR4 TaxID=3158265 RepID=UPI0034673591